MGPREEPLILRICLGRQMLADALQHSKQNLPTARMRCVLSLDHAVEIIVVTLLSELGTAVERSWSLPKMLEELSEQHKALKPHRQPIERLRRVRDRVQHDGIVPSPEDVRQFVGQVEAFIRDSIREVLGKELEECSLVSLVADEQAREHLINSERAIARNDPRLAVREAAISFALYWKHFCTRVRNHWSWNDRLVNSFSYAVTSAAKEVARKATEKGIRESWISFAREVDYQLTSLRNQREFTRLVRPLELAQFGIDMTAYSRFQRIVPDVLVAVNDEVLVEEIPGWSPTQQDALFVFDFVTAALLQLQDWLEVRDEYA